MIVSSPDFKPLSALVSSFYSFPSAPSNTMFASNYSVAVELLRRYLSRKGTVSIDSFSDTETCFLVDNHSVVLSLNDTPTSGDGSNVTVKFGKDPHSHSVSIDMAQFNLKLPFETIAGSVVADFARVIDEELRSNPGLDQVVPSRDDTRESVRQHRNDFTRETKRSSLDSVHGEEVSTTFGRIYGPGSFDDRERFSRPPDMPDFEDEYEIKRNERYSRPQNPPPIGDTDLNPAGLSGYPAMKPYLDPLAVNPHGGMHPDANHPLFGSGSRASRPGVPPGARYDDPYGDDNLDAMGMGSNMPRHNNRGGFGGSGFGGGGFGGGFT